MGSGGWMSLNQVGSLLLVSIDVIIINRLYGPEKCGIYGSIVQWAIMLRSLSLTVSGVLAPTIIKFYAQNDFEGLFRFLTRAVRLLGMFMALPIGLVCGFSEPILKVWLGPQFGQFSDLLILLVLPSCLNLPYAPLNHIFLTTNKVRVPGIVQVLAGLTNVGLALLLAVSFNLGIYGIALANIIVLTLRSNIFVRLYCAVILKKRMWDLSKGSFGIMGMTCLIFALSQFLSDVMPVDSLPVLAATAGLISITYLATYYAPFCLNISIRRKIFEGLAAMKSSLW
jgi:membrane protein EpsK